tara:strand:+ start:1203 stop:1712 length:510 start_codon:yes stop_codon:yes gene_type:complete
MITDVIEFIKSVLRVLIARTKVSKARRMFKRGEDTQKVKDTVWFGCRFHWSDPIYVPAALDLAFALYDRDRGGSTRQVAHCMLLLGRVFSSAGDKLPACRFFLCAREMFRSTGDSFTVPAMEFFREELDRRDRKSCFSMSRDVFETRYADQTASRLVKKYRNRNPRRRG